MALQIQVDRKALEAVAHELQAAEDRGGRAVRNAIAEAFSSVCPRRTRTKVCINRPRTKERAS